MKEELNKELEIIYHYRDLAEKNVIKKRGRILYFFIRLPSFLFPPISIDSKRWFDLELEKEYNRLMDEEGRAKLRALRPDIYSEAGY